jgi:hypothetical protein
MLAPGPGGSIATDRVWSSTAAEKPKNFSDLTPRLTPTDPTHIVLCELAR